MVLVHACVTKLNDELVWLRVGNLRYHVREESIRGDIERDAKTEIS